MAEGGDDGVRVVDVVVWDVGDGSLGEGSCTIVVSSPPVVVSMEPKSPQVFQGRFSVWNMVGATEVVVGNRVGSRSLEDSGKSGCLLAR